MRMRMMKSNEICISKDVAKVYLILAINYKNRISYLEREKRINSYKLDKLKERLKVVDKGVEEVTMQI